MKKYLQETEYINFNSEIVQSTLQSLNLEGLTQIQQAVQLFYFVRDTISYTVYVDYLDPGIYKASYILTNKLSFCIPKAITPCALARAKGIPGRIHLVDLRNFRLSQKLIQTWGGTNIMVSHTFAELYLEKKWVKATPAIDLRTCEKHGFFPVEFNGKQHALLQSKDKSGNPHAEYVKDHGTFADLPLNFIYNSFKQTYGSLSREKLDQFMGDKNLKSFI